MHLEGTAVHHSGGLRQNRNLGTDRACRPGM